MGDRDRGDFQRGEMAGRFNHWWSSGDTQAYRDGVIAGNQRRLMDQAEAAAEQVRMDTARSERMEAINARIEEERWLSKEAERQDDARIHLAHLRREAVRIDNELEMLRRNADKPDANILERQAFVFALEDAKNVLFKQCDDQGVEQLITDSVGYHSRGFEAPSMLNCPASIQRVSKELNTLISLVGSKGLLIPFDLVGESSGNVPSIEIDLENGAQRPDWLSLPCGPLGIEYADFEADVDDAYTIDADAMRGG